MLHISHISKFLQRNKIIDKRISVLSNNCLGGMICHDYEMEFLSPTVNLQLPYLDFIKLCNQPKEYLSMNLYECLPLQDEFKQLGGGEIDFPCATLGDLRILFQHYKSFQEAEAAWYRRCQRVLYDKVFVVFYTFGFVDKDVIERFKRIKYPKIMLTNQTEYVNGSEIIFFSPPEGKEWWEQDKSTKRRYYQSINWSKILNRIKWDEEEIME